MTTCAKEQEREGSVRFKGSKNVKAEGNVSAGTEQEISLFPDGIWGASRHCLAEQSSEVGCVQHCLLQPLFRE